MSLAVFRRVIPTIQVCCLEIKRFRKSPVNPVVPSDRFWFLSFPFEYGPETAMKKIEAFIKPFRLEEIKAALLEAGVAELRFTQVHEIGQDTSQENYRGTEYEVDFDARIMVMMVVEDDRVSEVTGLIRETASTENQGDGEILVMPVESMISI